MSTEDKVTNLFAADREPTLRELRLAFTSAQQALRRLQSYPVPLLNLATFRYLDADGHAGIDQALDLLEREVAVIRVILANHRARLIDSNQPKVG